MEKIQIELAVECYEKGMSSREIAEMENMGSRTTIIKELRNKGVEIRSEGFPLEVNDRGLTKLSEKEVKRWGFKTRAELEEHFDYWKIRGRGKGYNDV